MGDRILVTYASKHGATAEIAERIGKTLGKAGLPVDVMSVERVGDPAAYRAVVLGSGVYIGRWRRQAASFLRRNVEVLAGRPIWLFSSGPTNPGEPAAFMKGGRLPGSLLPVADRIKPRDIVIFHGAVDPKTLGFIEKWMIKNVKAPIGDFREWDAIDGWAKSISDALLREKP
jgi:menaquinone-dependent protoporphyrinogen oxidase